jgi:hypothetical protein
MPLNSVPDSNNRLHLSEMDCGFPMKHNYNVSLALKGQEGDSSVEIRNWITPDRAPGKSFLCFHTSPLTTQLFRMLGDLES